MTKCELARWQTCDDPQAFEYLSETLLLINGEFTLMGEGWAIGGFFGDCYGCVVPGSESNGIVFDTREYRLTKQQAAAWLYHREREGSGQFTGKSFAEMFPNTDVPGKPDLLNDPPLEFWDHNGIMTRLATWDGRNVHDIYDDLVEVLKRGNADDAFDAEVALADRCTGVWPDELGDLYQYFALDEMQRYITCEVMRPLPTLAIRKFDDMVTQPVLRAMLAGELLRWYLAFRDIANELPADDQERYCALAALPEDAGPEAIRATALSIITDSEWLPLDWSELVAKRGE